MNKLRRADRDYAKVSTADVIDVAVEDKYFKQVQQKVTVTDIRWVDLEEVPRTTHNPLGREDSSKVKNNVVSADSDSEDL